MGPKILLQSLKVQRKSFIFWGIGLLLLIAMYVALYPSIRDSAKAMNEFLQNMPEVFRKAFVGMEDYTSPAGYINTEVFAFMMPILFLFFSIGFGSGAIAGEEEKGTLDIILANPIKRWRIVLEKFGAMLVSLFILSILVVLCLLIATPMVDIHIGITKILAITLNLMLLALNFGTLSLFIGSIFGSQSLAIGVSTAIAVLSFFINTFASVSKFVENFQKFSPFYHYTANNPLVNGFNWGSIIFFVCVAIALLILSVAAFEKRDLNV